MKKDRACSVADLDTATVISFLSCVGMKIMVSYLSSSVSMRTMLYWIKQSLKRRLTSERIRIIHKDDLHGFELMSMVQGEVKVWAVNPMRGL